MARRMRFARHTDDGDVSLIACARPAPTLPIACRTTDFRRMTNIVGARVFLPLVFERLVSSPSISCACGACALPDSEGRFWALGVAVASATLGSHSDFPVLGEWSVDAGTGLLFLERDWSADPRSWIRHVQYDNPSWTKRICNPALLATLAQ